MSSVLRHRTLAGCRRPHDPALRQPPRRGGERTHLALQSHQGRWADTLTDGRYEAVDSGHFIQAEQPALVADGVRELLDRN
ncbi:hypothetical protein ACIGXI_38555 [Kitasatospora aureofaciens]|uniref:hypothetical protein n=1 Tax=Kitasatospora aureofaciens TaxID=1894 RepID=UPI0037C766BA